MAASLSDKLITGDGRTLTVGELVQNYRDIVSLSIPSQGRIQKLDENTYSLTNRFSTVDCDTIESIKTQKVYSLETKPTGDGQHRCIDSVLCVSDAFEVSELALVTSENGRFTARLKLPSKDAGSSSDGPKRQLLEIWDRSRLLKTLDTSDLEAHGSINTDGVFANMAWTTAGNQDKLVYVCQRKRPKHLSFFKPAKPAKEDDRVNSSDGSATRGEEYKKREDWGECLTGIEHTMVAILDVSNNCQITVIDVANHSLGQPQWLDNGNKLVCEAYPETPRRLGLIYCNSRPCVLMVFDWRSSSPHEPVLKLGSSTESYCCPRVSNSGDKFVFLSNLTYGAHAHSVKLNYYNIRAHEQRVLPVDLSGYDLFIDRLSKNCFTIEDKHIVFLSRDHLNNHMYLFTLETNKVTEIKFPNAGMSLLDFRYNIILASGSDIEATPTLFVATINSSNPDDVVAWHQIEDCIHLEEVEHESYKIPTRDESSFISAILTKPNLKALQANLNENTLQSKEKLKTNHSQLPTVVLIHGGPHSSFVTQYMPVLIWYTRLGLKVMLINYRGSTGVTEEYLQSLCGKIGTLDIEDCLEAIRYFAKNKLIDPTRLIINGGSHSGFIACHLSCQDEFKFISALIRNPVVDVVSMYGTTDIPDWIPSTTLAHTSYDPTWMPSEEELLKIRSITPMFNVAKANVPTMMQLGSKDRRVPMFQGERWVDALRARGVEVECKIYPDDHALSKPESATDASISSAIWFLSHLP